MYRSYALSKKVRVLAHPVDRMTKTIGYMLMLFNVAVTVATEFVDQC